MSNDYEVCIVARFELVGGSDEEWWRVERFPIPPFIGMELNAPYFADVVKVEGVTYVPEDHRLHVQVTDVSCLLSPHVTEDWLLSNGWRRDDDGLWFPGDAEHPELAT